MRSNYSSLERIKGYPPKGLTFKLEASSSPVLIGSFFVLLSVTAYWPCLTNGMVWDDTAIFFNNPLIILPGHWGRIWSGSGTPDYLPLAYSFFKLGWMIPGDRAFVFHTLNLVLHCTSTLLLWRLLFKLNMSGAWIGAALFAIHPVNVASVAWISEIKNTLSLPLVLGASLLFFCPPSRYRQLGSLSLFTISLLAKCSGVTVPVAWLLILLWKGDLNRKTVRVEILRILPFLFISLFAGLITLWFQSHRAIAGEFSAVNAGLLERIMRAFWAIGFDLRVVAWPSSLSFLYSNKEPTTDIAPWVVFTVASLVTIAALAMRKKWAEARGWLCGVGCFVVLALPVLGILPMYYLRLALVADQWLYLPEIPLLAMGGALLSKLGNPIVRLVLVGLILALFGYQTSLHCSDLRDNQTLWRTVLRADPKSWYAYLNLSVELGQAGKLDEAETLARTAVLLGGDEPETNLNLVSIIGLRNREKEALNVATNAAARFPKISAFPLVEGKLSARLGQMEQAADYFALALDLNPGDSVIFLCLADSLKQLNKPERLIAPTKRYLLLNPDDSDAWTYLGMACAVTGRRMEAESCFLKALEFSKDKAAALENLEMLRKMPSN